MTKRTALLLIIAAFMLGGAVANLQAWQAVDDLQIEVNSLRDENRELISLLEESK